MADEAYCGKAYRVLTKRLRIARGPGNPDRIVERPSRLMRDKSGTYDLFLDDDNPTLVTFDAGDLVDVTFLLRCGAIVEASNEGVTDG